VRLKSPAAQLPRRILPMLVTSSAPFDDSRCLFEIKWDGVRVMASIAKGTWHVWGRECVDYTERYPELEVLRKLPAGTILDGELVAVRDGRPDFYSLMSRHSRRPRRTPFFTEAVQYVVFDVLYFRGRSLMGRPLEERRQLLHHRLPKIPFVSLCDGVVGAGRSFFQSAIAAGHEGIVAKKLSSPYVPNQRSAAWRKIKQKMELPCVVIGYRTRGSELCDLLMATLVERKLAFVGAVELGIRDAAGLVKRLNSLRTAAAAVPCSLPARWVRPELFCKVHFCGWRPGGVWRDPVFVGWDQ